MNNNEGFYQSLFMNNRAIMLLINPETSEIVDCNRSACSFYGYSYVEMLKLKITDINSLTVPQVVKEMILAKVEESNHFYFKHRLFNGQIRDVEVNSTPIFFEGRNLLSSIIWDITDCSIYSNKLKVENSNLEKVVAERTYQLEEANAMLQQEILGHKETEQALKYELSSNLENEVLERTKQLEETNDIMLKQKVQLEGILENMSDPLFDNQDNFINGLLCYRDITEKVYMEKALEDSEAKYKGLFNNMPLGMALYKMITDDYGKPIDYSLIELNPIFERIKGYKRDEILGKKVTEIIPGIENSAVNRIGLFGEIALTGKSVAREVYSEISNKWYDTYYYCPQPGCVASIFSDITLRKNQEKELRILKEQLQEAQEFAHLGYWEFDIISGDYPWSDELFSMYGFKPQEFVPTLNDFIAIIHPEDKEFMMNVIKEPSNVKKCELDFRIIRQDHEIIWIHEKIKYEYDASGKEIRRYGVVLDITQRKLSELKLKESEEKFKQLFENMTNGFSLHEVVMDEQGEPIDFRFLLINKAYEDQMNVRSEDILGKTILEIDPAADKERILKYCEVGLTGNSQFEEYYSKTFNRYFRVSVYSPQRGLFASIFEDVTVQKRSAELEIANIELACQNQEKEKRAAELEIAKEAAEAMNQRLVMILNELEIKEFEQKLSYEKIIESQQETASILESMTDCFIAIDKNWQFTYINRAAEIAYGKPRDELLGKKINEIYRISDATLQHFQNVMAGSRSITFENISGFLGNKWVEISLYPTETGLTCYFRDISSRKIAEETLRQSEEKFSKAFHGGPIMMTLATVEEGKFIDVNEALCSGTGYSREEIIDYTTKELNFFVDRAKRQENGKLLMEQGRLENAEVDFRTKLGEIRHGISWSQLFYLDGKPCHITGLIDVTEHKRIQKEMAKLDRLNLVGQLAAGIAHEIRNPMTTVRGYLQLLGAKPEFADKKHTFELMISEVDRANAIITEFLSLAQTKYTELKSQNLNDIFSNLYPLIEADTFTQNKQICFIPGEIPDIELNGKEISQLILNLTRNGLEAMEENGSITIKSYVEDSMVVLSIADEGCGISPENIKKLGIPFFTTKDDGTGLGIATCYKIAESHNAKVDIETSPTGTTFLILFPIPVKKLAQNARIF